MSERKFTRNLIKQVSASVLRETVSSIVRESTNLVRESIFLLSTLLLNIYIHMYEHFTYYNYRNFNTN